MTMTAKSFNAGFHAGQLAARKIAVVENAKLVGHLAHTLVCLKVMALGDPRNVAAATRVLLASTAAIAATLAAPDPLARNIYPEGIAA